MDHEDDPSNLSEDSRIYPIMGMESVVATVSGYHGTERFKVIKLIACTGANYVGAMDRSITHLVCWKFEGRKYDLARKLETHIISHSWLEDCLKEGRRLPEGPYTMQSGQEVGPISWEVPAILDGNVKKRCPCFGERNEESNHYKASHSAKGKEITPVCLNWSDSHLLKENYFHGWDTKKRLSNSQGGRKSRRVLMKSHQSNRHQITIIDDPGNWPECSSRSSTRVRHRRNFYDDANGEIYAEPTDESNDAVQISELVDLDKLVNQSASPSLEKALERIFYENEESRRIGHGEDIVEPNEFSNLVNSGSSERCHVLTVEGDSKIINSVEVRGTDLCEAGEHKDESSDCDALSAPRGLDPQTELSCVICWTEFCSVRGVLPCGHRFCYSCIQEWADCMASRGKVSTCPLCKANFTIITKVEELSSSEQKIFSQSIPCSSSKLEIFCLPGNRYDTFRASSSASICSECQNREPEDLLLSCHICWTQWVHSCCLDPPLIPWTCIHCRDLRMLYQRFR